MKLYKKLLIAILLPIVLFMGTAGGISYYFAHKSLIEQSSQWLEIRLSEALLLVKKHENILHKYDLQNIPASIAKAKLDALAELSSTKIGKNGYIFIADQQGVIVSHPDKYYVGTDAGQDIWFRQLTEKKAQSNLSIRDIKYLAAHDFFAPWNWYVIVVEPEISTFQTIQKIKTFLLFLTISAFIAIFCFTYFFTRRLTEPIDLISKGLLQIDAGEFETQINIRTTDEFADLARAFNQMAKQFQNRLNQLHKDHAYYNTLCHQTTDLITITDLHGQFIFASPSAKRILGYTPEELLGKKVSEFINPSQKDQLIEHFRLATLSDVASPPAEFSFKHKEGYLCTLESISKDLLSHPDVKGFVTTSRNINKHKSTRDALKKSNKELEKQAYEKDKEMSTLHQRLADKTKSQKNHQADLKKMQLAFAKSLKNFGTKISNDLSPVTGFSQLLPSMIHDKQIRVYLSAINRAGSTILQTGKNMKTLADLSSQTFYIQKKETNIHHLLDDLSLRYESMIIEKPILFIKNFDALLPNSLLLDKAGLEQILFNLMDNAIRRTQSGHIKITSRLERMSEDGSSIDLNISIEDTGIRLDNNSLEMMSSGNDIVNAVENMDLFICRHLSHLLGGHLDVKHHQDVGASFKFSVPKIKIGKNVDALQTTSFAIKENRFKGFTCLIADESTLVCLMLSHTLKYAGIKPIICDTGAQLTRMAKEETPHLIFLSTSLLDLNGINILSLLKNNTLTQSIPVILLATHESGINPDPQKNDSNNDFLLKPIDIQMLHQKLHKYLKPELQDKPEPDVFVLSIDPILQCWNENHAFKENLKHNIISRLPEFEEGITMSRINDFADHIIQLGEQFKLDELTSFGKKLSRDAQSFNIEKLETSLGHLSRILNTIEQD